jgi:protein MpaA
VKFKSLSLLLALSIFSGFAALADTIESSVPQLCDGLEKAFQKRSWGESHCSQIEWKEGGKSVEGRPLLYYVFGPETATNTTLLFSMVHGDEITPLFISMKLVEWARENMKAHPTDRLILAPLVNPDGFFGFPKTRTNAHGVDCNRNFPTKDWDREALKAWKTKFHSEKRRFPGWKSDSEPETQFQKMLIEKFSPQKIVSIHSPLNVIDYDGPDGLKLAKFSEEYVKKCVELRNRIRAKSTGFFPGSLGNYAGQDLGIPTITLELPTASANKAAEYWKIFQKGIATVVSYQVPTKKK